MSSGLVVGLIASPMMTTSCPNVTVLVAEATFGTDAFSQSGDSGMSFVKAIVLLMCSGVVPQQPPKSVAPASAISFI